VAEALFGDEGRAEAANARSRRDARGLPVDDHGAGLGVVRSPDSAANNSSWPLPATPAMPKISPPLTSTET
jgi:hypothetical protein